MLALRTVVVGVQGVDLTQAGADTDGSALMNEPDALQYVPVFLEIVCFDTSAPYASARYAAFFPCVSQLADNDSTNSRSSTLSRSPVSIRASGETVLHRGLQKVD